MVRLNRPKCRPDPEEVSETGPAEEDRFCIPRRAHRELAGGVAETTYEHPALVLLLLPPLVQDAELVLLLLLPAVTVSIVIFTLLTPLPPHSSAGQSGSPVVFLLRQLSLFYIPATHPTCKE